MATLIATALPTASDITVVKNGSDTGSSPAPEKLANTVTVNEVQDSCSLVDDLQYKIVTVRKADGSIGKVRKLITPAATETSSTPAAPFQPQPVALLLQGRYSSSTSSACYYTSYGSHTNRDLSKRLSLHSRHDREGQTRY